MFIDRNTKSYQFSQIDLQIQHNGCLWMLTSILKFIWRGKRPRTANLILKEKNKYGGLTLLDLKTHYKAIVIKTVWYWWNTKQIDQWNKIKSLEINPHKYSQLIFDKGSQAIQWSKTSLSTDSGRITNPWVVW